MCIKRISPLIEPVQVPIIVGFQLFRVEITFGNQCGIPRHGIGVGKLLDLGEAFERRFEIFVEFNAFLFDLAQLRVRFVVKH